MKSLFLTIAFAVFFTVKSVLGQVGREYGNPGIPFVLSHLPEKNQRMLRRGNSPHHTVFTRLICFKWACRLKARENKSLHAISFSKFKKRIRKNAKKGMYKNMRIDSIPTKKQITKIQPEQIVKTEAVPLMNKEPNVNAQVLKSDTLIVLNEFLFETNSSTLKGDQFSALDSIMDFLIVHPSLIVKISGHTDSTGKESHNKNLSTKRAEVVAEYLIGNGVSDLRVSFEGLGSARPIASNATEIGRSKNRRVELLIHDRH